MTTITDNQDSTIEYEEDLALMIMRQRMKKMKMEMSRILKLARKERTDAEVMNKKLKKWYIHTWFQRKLFGMMLGGKLVDSF